MLTWAPHIKPLPHAVPNSFVRAMKKMNFDISITNPEGFDLDPTILKGIKTNNNQLDAFKELTLFMRRTGVHLRIMVDNDKNDWIIDEKDVNY